MNNSKEISEQSNSERQNLLNECFRLRLPVEKDDDLELLRLIFEAAMERNSNGYDLNSHNDQPKN